MSLSLYNPVLNMWHGVKRSLNMQVNTAFNLQVSFNATQEGVSFTIQHTPGTANWQYMLLYYSNYIAEIKLYKVQ
jgi:hypothetical protein